MVVWGSSIKMCTNSRAKGEMGVLGWQLCIPGMIALISFTEWANRFRDTCLDLIY